MKKKNRKLRAALCVCAALLILSMAVFANYDNAGGYAAIKNGVKSLLYQDNCTLNVKADVSLDGASIGCASEMTYKLDKNGEVQTYMRESYANLDGVQDVYEVVEQNGDRYVYSEYVAYDTGEKQVDKLMYPDSGDGTFFDVDDELFDKGVNFVETLSDVLVGDIKNNIVLAQTDGANRTYSLNMSGEQLPKYMTAAFSFICAGSRQDAVFDLGGDMGAVMNNMMINQNEPYINNVCGNVTLDDRDRITAFDGKVTVTGYDENNDAHDLCFNLSLTAGGYGTTKIDPVNPDEYQNVRDLPNYVKTESVEVSGDDIED